MSFIHRDASDAIHSVINQSLEISETVAQLAKGVEKQDYSLDDIACVLRNTGNDESRINYMDAFKSVLDVDDWFYLLAEIQGSKIDSLWVYTKAEMKIANRQFDFQFVRYPNVALIADILKNFNIKKEDVELLGGMILANPKEFIELQDNDDCKVIIQILINLKISVCDLYSRARYNCIRYNSTLHFEILMLLLNRGVMFVRSQRSVLDDCNLPLLLADIKCDGNIEDEFEILADLKHVDARDVLPYCTRTETYQKLLTIDPTIRDYVNTLDSSNNKNKLLCKLAKNAEKNRQSVERLMLLRSGSAFTWNGTGTK